MTKDVYFSKSASIILNHELKGVRGNYYIDYGHPDYRKRKTFKTKNEAYNWIKKNKKYFPPTGVYKRREEPEWMRKIS